MIDEKDKINPTEARVALETIQEMERAGLRRGIPSYWYGAALALLTGVLFTLAGLELSRLYMAPVFLLMVVVVILQTRNAGVIVKPFLSKQRYASERMIIIALISAVVIGGTSIVVARELRDTFGNIAPLALGVVITIVGFIMSVLERRSLIARTSVENGA